MLSLRQKDANLSKHRGDAQLNPGGPWSNIFSRVGLGYRPIQCIDAATRIILSASSPRAALSGCIFHDSNWCRRIWQWVVFSSTTSTRIPETLCVSIGITGPRCFSSLAVNQNFKPLSGTLSTPILPSMMVTRCQAIARPRPVPPYLRVVEPSAWLEEFSLFRQFVQSSSPLTYDYRIR